MGSRYDGWWYDTHAGPEEEEKVCVTEAHSIVIKRGACVRAENVLEKAFQLRDRVVQAVVWQRIDQLQHLARVLLKFVPNAYVLQVTGLGTESRDLKVLKSMVFAEQLFLDYPLEGLDVGGDHAWVDDTRKLIWVSTFRTGGSGVHMLDYDTGALKYSVTGLSHYLPNQYLYSAGIHGTGTIGRQEPSLRTRVRPRASEGSSNHSIFLAKRVES